MGMSKENFNKPRKKSTDIPTVYVQLPSAGSVKVIGIVTENCNPTEEERLAAKKPLPQGFILLSANLVDKDAHEFIVNRSGLIHDSTPAYTATNLPATVLIPDPKAAGKRLLACSLHRKADHKSRHINRAKLWRDPKTIRQEQAASLRHR